MQYLVNDSHGHVADPDDVLALQSALLLLNDSETISQMEEDGNYHSASQWRDEMAESLHVAEITLWETSDDDSDWEIGTCVVCDGEVEREKNSTDGEAE